MITCNYCLHKDSALPSEHESYVICRKCGSMFLDPPPTARETAEANEGMYAIQSHPDNSGHMRLHPDWRKRLHEQWAKTLNELDVEYEQPLTNHNWSLDVGCSSGTLMDWLDSFGWKTHGIDISNAQTRYVNPIHECRVGDMRDGKWRGLGFNLVTMFDVIEHIDDQDGMLKAIWQSMDPGGTLVLACPCTGLVSKAYGRHWRQLLVPQHIAIPSRIGLTSVLTRNRFEVRHIITWGSGMGDTGEVPDRHRLAWNRIAKQLHIGDTIAVSARKP